MPELHIHGLHIPGMEYSVATACTAVHKNVLSSDNLIQCYKGWLQRGWVGGRDIAFLFKRCYLLPRGRLLVGT